MGYLYFRGKYHAAQFCQFNLLGFNVLAYRPLTAYLLIEEIFLRDVYKTSISSSRPVIIDGGAHLGLALFYFKYWYSNAEAKIVAFEPQAKLFSLLEENVKKNRFTDVRLIHGCLAAEKGTVKLFRASSRLNYSLIAPFEDATDFEWIRSYHLSDSISGQMVDLIKLDIEGSEIDVIRESSERNLLSNSANYIIELHKTVSSSHDRLYSAFETGGFRSLRVKRDISKSNSCDQVWSFERLKPSI